MGRVSAPTATATAQSAAQQAASAQATQKRVCRQIEPQAAEARRAAEADGQ